MSIKSSVIVLGLAVALMSVPSLVAAQADVLVQSAELSVPFGSREGRLVLVGDQLVFVDTNETEASFAVTRSNVTAIDQTERALTLTLRQPVRNGQREVSFRVADPATIVAWHDASPVTSASVATPTDIPPSDVIASYQAQHNHRLGRNCLGQLIITEDRVIFESVSELDHSRQWAYADIRELELDGIYQVHMTPFIGNGYDLELVGRGMDSAQYRMLVDRISSARAR